MLWIKFLLLLTAVMSGAVKIITDITPLVHNPQTLRELSVGRVKQSISCINRPDVKESLMQKLRADDIEDLRNPNVPVSLEDMCKYLSLISNGT